MNPKRDILIVTWLGILTGLVITSSFSTETIYKGLLIKDSYWINSYYGVNQSVKVVLQEQIHIVHIFGLIIETGRTYFVIKGDHQIMTNNLEEALEYWRDG